MSYAVIEDFRGGVDRRRSRSNGAPGTLWVGSNCHITKGGEIHKRYKMVPKYQLYPGHTWGMKGVGTKRYVFGYEDSAGFPPTGIPSGVTYQRLVHPVDATTPISRVLDAIAFQGGVYTIVEFTDMAVHHYWNGTRVTDWDGGAGNPTAKGRFGIAIGSKIYIAAGSIVYFCDINDPTNWTTGGTNGAGFFNVTSSGKGSEDLVAMTEFQNGIAFFASSFSQIWTVDADPTKNAVRNTIDNAGAVCPHAVVNFGNIDSFVLSSTGIRSLRQQTINGQPYAADMGDNIDDLVQLDLSALDVNVLARSQAAVSPTDGRVWFWIGERIYVLSSFSSSKIQAWSWYDMAGILPNNLDVIAGRINLRSGDTIYVYGGDSGREFDTDDSDLYHADVELPYMNAGRIADDKTATSYNVGLTGEWEVYMKSNPQDPDIEDALGIVNLFTYPDPTYPMGIESTHFAPRFRSRLPGAATISTFAFGFERAE